MTRKPVSRACDACRKRKIKCNGLQPCPPCVAASVACTFLLEHRKGGNQGARATVLNSLRASSSAGSPAERESVSFASPSVVKACIEAYLVHIYHIIPFLTREVLEKEVQHAHISADSRLFLASFCAYVGTFGNVLEMVFPTEANMGQALLDQAVQLLPADRAAFPSPRSVFVSFFLYGAYAGLGNYWQAWFYLREATTTLMMCEKTSEDIVFSSAVFARLFWILLISERSHGIRRGRPITLQINASSPRLEEKGDYLGLKYLVDIFRPFDEVFFSVWNGSATECSKEWLFDFEIKVQRSLPATLDVPNGQIANLRVTQCWLQIKLWELFPRFGYLSSASTHDCLTFRYPINVARDLALLGMQLPVDSFMIHGVGMTEKIFDVACALTDVLPFVSKSGNVNDSAAVEYLRQLTVLLTKLPYGSIRFVPLLLIKVQELLPDVVGELYQVNEIPSPSNSNFATSRHLYEEEVGDLYTHLRNGVTQTSVPDVRT